MLMESQVKFRGPYNISGASQHNSIASFSQSTQVNSSFSIIQVYGNPKI